MMQETPACATRLMHRTLNGPIVTRRPGKAIHPAQQKKTSVAFPIRRMAYLAAQAFHFIELIPPFAFVLQRAHIFIIHNGVYIAGSGRLVIVIQLETRHAHNKQSLLD